MKNDSIPALILVFVIVAAAAWLLLQDTATATPVVVEAKFYNPPEPLRFCVEKTFNSRNVDNITAFSIREGQYGEDPDFYVAYKHQYGVMEFEKVNQWVCSPSFGIAPETHCIHSVDRTDQRQDYFITSGELFQQVSPGNFEQVAEIGFPVWPIFIKTYPREEVTQWGVCDKAWLPNVAYGYPGPYPGDGPIYRPPTSANEVTK